ncbi:MAG: polysaccharide biosynthesis/export family protein [Desulfobacteraceae bacterium]
MQRVIALVILLIFTSPLLANALEEKERYGIGPGDTLEISVWKDESLTRQLIVPPDGMISFPLIGEIDASGKTVTQLHDIVEEQLSEYIPDVTVNVMLIEAISLRAYVIGKVNKPGMFPITQDTTVLQILAMAGGLNAFAAEEDILVLRRRQGGMTKLPFDYEEIRNGENLEQNIVLERGDVVVVP